MRLPFILVLAAGVVIGLARAQGNGDQTANPVALPATNAPAPPANPPASAGPKPASSKTLRTSAQLQAALDQLAQSNRDLLDLLKQQQSVLEDIQYDRRLQSRQIASLEERLTEA